MSCCTANAWGDLKNPDYQEKGQVERVEDIDIYRWKDLRNTNAATIGVPGLISFMA